MTRKIKTSASSPSPVLPAVAAWQAAVIGVLRRGIGLIENNDLPPEKRTRKGRQTAKAAVALLRLAPPGLKRKAMGQRLALSGVRRMLTASRDSDALVEAFDHLAPSLLIARTDLAALHKIVAGQRDMHDSAAGERAKAVHIFANLIRQIELWGHMKGGIKPLLATIGTDYRKLRRGMKQAFTDEDIDALHAMRKRVIIHRHQTGLMVRLAGNGKEAGKGRDRLLKHEAQAKALGVALGRHRDLCLLDDLLRGQQSPKLHNAIERTLVAIADEQARQLEEARRLSARLTRRKRRDFLAWAERSINR